MRKGQTHIEVIGSPRFDSGDQPHDTSIFRISSVTKPVTAVALLLLLEECVLRLDDPVDELLPELAHRRVVRTMQGPVDDTVPAIRPITVRDFLSFRTGFGECPVNDEALRLLVGVGSPRPQEPPVPDDSMRGLSSLPLMCQPGGRWLYHAGADVLGVLIACVTGQPLEVFLRERIFEPLAMADTSFWVEPAKVGRLVTRYATNVETKAVEVCDEPQGQWSSKPAFPSGGAGPVSSARDYLAFVEMLRRDGSPLLSRSSVSAMTSDQLTPEQKARSGFYPGDFDAMG